MPNGSDINDELEFEKHIKGLDDRKLIEFVARQQYDTNTIINKHSHRINRLEGRGRKELGITGGFGAFVGVAIATTIDILTRR